jgi:hypothetical protein
MGAIDSEFKAMRAEIGRLIDHQRDLQNLSYISLGALLAFIGVLVKDAGAPDRLATVLLLIPFLTLQFAFTAADISRRIIQLGRYIDTLTADANNLLDRFGRQAQGEIKVWQWERWKSCDFEKKSSAKRKMVIVLEKSRWLSLAFPGIVGVLAYLKIDDTPMRDLSEEVLFVLAIAVVIVSIAALTVYASEARGVVKRHR